MEIFSELLESYSNSDENHEEIAKLELYRMKQIQNTMDAEGVTKIVLDQMRESKNKELNAKALSLLKNLLKFENEQVPQKKKFPYKKKVQKSILKTLESGKSSFKLFSYLRRELQEGTICLREMYISLHKKGEKGAIKQPGQHMIQNPQNLNNDTNTLNKEIRDSESRRNSVSFVDDFSESKLIAPSEIKDSVQFSPAQALVRDFLPIGYSIEKHLYNAKRVDPIKFLTDVVAVLQAFCDNCFHQFQVWG